MLKQHVAALYLNLPTPSIEATNISDGIAGLLHGDKALFQEIVRLKLGESLLFCLTAVVTVAGEGVRRIEGGYVKFKTKQRVTADGGKSRLAAKA